MARRDSDGGDPNRLAKGEGKESGLTLRGTILAREHRIVKSPQTGEDRRYVQYRVLAGIDVFFVEDWSGETAMPVGSEIQLPVYVRTFTRKGGSPAFSLGVRVPREED